jgi:mono/diheme cytochrome c family protein
MDDPNRENDKEFEAFLRQFQLRQAGPLTESTSGQAASGHGKRRWIFAAAAVIAVAFLSTSLIWNMRSRGPSATIEVAGDSSYRIGEKIAGVPIRSGSVESTALVLEDGSRVEMRAQSELFIESAPDGVRIRLDKGTILVTAAKLPEGHLHVKTADALVSVVGAVFVVDARPSGMRVGVLHGEIEVRQRETLRRVLQGQQTSTDPSFEEQSLAEMIAWSRSAERLRELLPQSPVASPQAEPGPQPQVTGTGRRAVSATSQRGGEQEPPSQPQPSPTPEQPPQQSDAGADGPGRQIFYRACSSCHVAEVVNTRHYSTREAYAALVAKEMQYGASLSTAEVQVLVDYLFKTYGAKKN